MTTVRHLPSQLLYDSDCHSWEIDELLYGMFDDSRFGSIKAVATAEFFQSGTQPDDYRAVAVNVYPALSRFAASIAK